MHIPEAVNDAGEKTDEPAIEISGAGWFTPEQKSQRLRAYQEKHERKEGIRLVARGNYLQDAIASNPDNSAYQHYLVQRWLQ